MAIDFDGLRRDNPIADVVGRYVELRRSGSQYTTRCPFHADRNPSFYVVPSKDRAFCMGCGWQGDCVDFVVEYERLSDDPGYPDTPGARSALRKAAEMLGADELPKDRPAPAPLPPDLSEEWVPVLPVPAKAPPPFEPPRTNGVAAADEPGPRPGAWRIWNPKRGRWWRFTPTMSWPYRDADGRLLGWVARIQFDDGAKVTPQVTYCRHSATGEERWCSRPFPLARPLLGLDDLAKRPDAPVLLVSGEKCHSAATRLLPGFVAATWPGGDRGVGHVDWTPLYGRAVTGWHDLDRQRVPERIDPAQPIKPWAEQSGYASMVEALTALSSHGGALRLLDLRADFDADTLVDGWDIADAEADGWDTARVVEFCRSRVRPWAPPEPDATPPEPEGAASPDKEPEGETGATPVREPAPEGEAAARLEDTDSAPENATKEVSADDAADPRGSVDTADAEPGGAHPSPRATAGAIVGLAPPRSETYDAFVSWEQMGLKLNDKNSPFANLDNACRILDRHPELCGAIWYDEFLQRVMTTWLSQDGPREWQDHDDVRLQTWIQRRVGLHNIGLNACRDAVTVTALANVRNEAAEWLRSLTWDKTPRIQHAIPLGWGAEAGDYAAAVGRYWFCGMVARVLSPGCQVDMMPVFEGSQGLQKSTALRVVGGKWFAECHENVLSKDFYLVLQGKMLVEIAEMHAFAQREVEQVKGVISNRSDRFRTPYGRRAADYPRSGTFAGTTNRDDWNQDETGARRFLPVACTAVDLAWLARWRDQLFAEAVARYLSGETWWDVPETEARAEQDKRRRHDSWETAVRSFTAGRTRVQIGEVLEQALRIEVGKQDTASQRRCGTVLRALGWHSTVVWENGRSVRYWVPKDPAQAIGQTDLL